MHQSIKSLPGTSHNLKRSRLVILINYWACLFSFSFYAVGFFVFINIFYYQYWQGYKYKIWKSAILRRLHLELTFFNTIKHEIKMQRPFIWYPIDQQEKCFNTLFLYLCSLWTECFNSLFCSVLTLCSCLSQQISNIGRLAEETFLSRKKWNIEK